MFHTWRRIGRRTPFESDCSQSANSELGAKPNVRDTQGLLSLEDDLVQLINSKVQDPVIKRIYLNLIGSSFAVFQTKVDPSDTASKRMVDLDNLALYEKMQSVINSLISVIILEISSANTDKKNEQFAEKIPAAPISRSTVDEFEDSEDTTNPFTQSSKSLNGSSLKAIYDGKSSILIPGPEPFQEMAW